MSVFESSAAHYNAALPTVWYESELGLYRGEVISRTGMLRSYGPSERSVEFDLENQLYWEYQELLRQIELDEQNRAAAAEREKAAQEHQASQQHHHSHGGGFIPHTFGMMNNSLNHASHAIMSYGVLTPISLTGKSTGKIVSRGKGKKKKKGGLLGIFSQVRTEQVFMASVAGVTIAATSRKALKKLLIRQRNKHIQRIMMNVKAQQKNVERTKKAQERTQNLRERIRNKKATAEKLGSGLWTERVATRGRNKNWEERLDHLRDRVQSKKEYALAALST